MPRPANPALREEILAAAVRIIEGCGPDCVTMREVAEEVGYSPTTLYLYFKDKSEILREVVLRGFDDLGDFLEMSGVGPGPIDDLRQRNRAYIMWAITNPGRYLLMFERPAGVVPASEEDIARVTRGIMGGIKDVQEAIATGVLKGVDDGMSFGTMLWAGTHGIATLAIARRLGRDMPSMKPADVVALATAMGDEMLLRMLTPPSA